MLEEDIVQLPREAGRQTLRWTRKNVVVLGAGARTKHSESWHAQASGAKNLQAAAVAAYMEATPTVENKTKTTS